MYVQVQALVPPPPPPVGRSWSRKEEQGWHIDWHGVGGVICLHSAGVGQDELGCETFN